MGTRAVVLLLGVALISTPCAAIGQETTKVWRIGFLGMSTHGAAASHVGPFVEALRSAGYIEGQNLVIEYRFAAGKPEALPRLADELVRLKIDLIVTSGALAALSMKRATTATPIVMAQVTDPVGLGLAASLGRPGGNVTGLASLHSDLGPKQLELIREAVPGLKRIACLWNASNPGSELIVRHLRHAGAVMALTVRPFEIRDPTEPLETTIEEIARLKMQALIVPPDPLLFAHVARVVRLAERHRLPAIYGWREVVESGGLMSYGPSVPEMFQRAAAYVDKILKGTQPAQLPIEQPTRFEFVINVKSARTLGLTLPQSLLVRADTLIE